MLRRVLSNLTTTTKLGIFESPGPNSATWVRFMSKKRAENLRKINPKVPYTEAISIAQELYNLFHKHGPLTYGATWTSIQEAGVQGLTSKTHMKLMLKWMRGKKIIRQICQQVGSNKKFLLCTPDAAKTELEAMALVEKKPTAKKPSQKPKKKVKKNK